MPPAALASHIRVKAACDLALDTRAVNGHSYTADMLYASVPVVTIRGRQASARTASSFLFSLGLGDMVADNLEVGDGVEGSR
jgi:predicted O-linked N-acetylglucosamine transferase (SPINDLY family)